MTVSASVKRNVWIAAGGRCCLCKQPVDWDRNVFVNIGEVAHIVGQGYGTTTPRGNPSIPAAEIDAVENLILLCPNDHRTVDGRLEESFPEEALRELKQAHEDAVSLAVDHAFGKVRTSALRMTGPVQTSTVSIPTTDAISAAVKAGLVPVSFRRHDAIGASIELPDLTDPAARRPATTAMISEHVERLRSAYAEGRFDVISVFAFADLPAIVALGHEMNELPIRPFQRNPNTADWEWPSKEQTVSFNHSSAESATGANEIVIAADISGTVDVTNLPASIRDLPILRIAPVDVNGGRDIIQSEADVGAFRDACVRLLAILEAVAEKPLTVHLVGPMPTSIGVTAGNVLAHMAVAELVLYQFSDGQYAEEARL